MIYKNPKNLLNKYLNHMNHHNLSDQQFYNKLTESLDPHKRVKLSTPEALEHDYMLEYFRRKLLKNRSSNGLKIIKQKRLSPLGPNIDLEAGNRHSEESSSLKTSPHNHMQGPQFIDENPFKAKSSYRLSSASRFESTKANSSSSTPHCNKPAGAEVRKVKLIPKNKSKARFDYYDNNVRRQHFPLAKESKRLELNLRSFSSERLKTFKDFRVVRLFK